MKLGSDLGNTLSWLFFLFALAVFALQKTKSNTIISSEGHICVPDTVVCRGDSLDTQKWKSQIARAPGLELDPTWHLETQELESVDIQWSEKEKSSSSVVECFPGMHEVSGSIPGIIPFCKEIQDIPAWLSQSLPTSLYIPDLH